MNVSAQTFIGTDLGKSEVANPNATVSKTAAVQPVAAAQTAVAPEPLPIGNVQSPPGIQATNPNLLLEFLLYGIRKHVYLIDFSQQLLDIFQILVHDTNRKAWLRFLA